MKAIILAAGSTTGFSDSEKSIPKCLIEIGGQTILERQIKILNSCGIESKDIIVVIGKKGVWSEENKIKANIVSPNILINPHNLETHNSYSFWLATKDITEEVLCVDGDLFFSREVINNVINNLHPSLLLTKKMKKPIGANKVKVFDGKVSEISNYSEPEVIYVGLAKFNSAFLEDLKKEVCRIEYFKSSLAEPLNELCSKHALHVVDDEEIININTIKDYKKARKSYGDDEKNTFNRS